MAIYTDAEGHWLVKFRHTYDPKDATSVNFTGYPTLQDFIAVGTKIKMNKKRCQDIFDEVYQNCGDLLLNKIPVK